MTLNLCSELTFEHRRTERLPDQGTELKYQTPHQFCINTNSCAQKGKKKCQCAKKIYILDMRVRRSVRSLILVYLFPPHWSIEFILVTLQASF
jgi:hypothetical protein